MRKVLIVALGLALATLLPISTLAQEEPQPPDITMQISVVPQPAPPPGPKSEAPPILVPGPMTLAQSLIPCMCCFIPICMYADRALFSMTSPENLTDILVGKEGQGWDTGVAPGLIGGCFSLCGGGGGGGGGDNPFASCTNCFDCVNGCVTMPFNICRLPIECIKIITGLIPFA